MTEEKQPEEKKEKRPPVKLADLTLNLIKAHDLAEIATGYRPDTAERKGCIVLPEGPTQDNPTLMQYIKRAEADFLRDNADMIVKSAGQFIAKELDDIRGMLV